MRIRAAMVLMVLCCTSAPAQDGHRHAAEDMPAHHSFYYYLTRPDVHGSGPGSCCGDGDCRPVRARFVDRHWEALQQDGSWVSIPNERIVTRQDELARRPDHQAVLCALPRFIYCFVPPETGG